MLTLLQRPKRATPEVMSSFHTDEYVNFLHNVTLKTAEQMAYHGTRCVFTCLCSLFVDG